MLTLGRPIVRQATETKWSLAQCVAFRFVCVYLVVYKLPYYLYFLGGQVEQTYTDFLHSLVPWIGAHVLHLKKAITVFPNGSGDTTYNYVEILCFVVAALMVTCVWSLVDSRRGNYKVLHEWLRVYVRFALASPMLGYGAAKIFEGQFGSPTFSMLLETYGESSPMGLLWTFMGSSRAYCIFGGLAEVIAGLLLIVPRFTTLGALIAFAVMSNVFMMNLCYDVPVKLYSFHLLLMSAFLLIPDLSRLANVLIFNRDAKATVATPLTRIAWLNIALLIGQLALGGYIACRSIYSNYKYADLQIAKRDKIPFYGVWSVDEFAIDGKVRAPLVTDSACWRRVFFDRYDQFVIQFADGHRESAEIRYERKGEFILRGELKRGQDSKFNPLLSYDDSQKDKLIISGDIGKHKIFAKLHKDDVKFLLTSRGFHWINEYPCEQ